jgi:hypothetical protein
MATTAPIARKFMKIQEKRKAAGRHSFVNKTRQATVTSAEVETDDL